MRDDETQRTGTATAEAAEGRLVPLSELHNHRITSGDPDVRGWEVMGSDGRRLGRVHDLLVDTGSQRVRYLDMELDHDLTSVREGGREPLGPEGQPMAGAETVGLADPGIQEGPAVVPTSGAVRAEVEPITGRLDESAHRPGHDATTETVGPDALAAAASGPLFARDERPITGRLDEGIRHVGDRHVLIPIGLGRLAPGDDRIYLASLRAEEAASLPAYTHGEVSRDLEAELQRGWIAGKAPGDFDLYDDSRFYGGRRGGR
jgi:hypothetical protein